MVPKVKNKASEKKKSKKMISMEVKHEIIEKHERGVRIIDLASEYGRSASTISTIIKQKEAIMKMQPSKGVTIISKLRTDTHDKMEKLLLLWINEKQLAGEPISEAIISRKAIAIFQDLKRDAVEIDGELGSEEFKASRGWFDNFKKRSGIRSAIRHEEACADIKAAENFINDFEKLIDEEGYLPEQDVADFVEIHTEELTTDDLMEIQTISHSGVVMEHSEDVVEHDEELTSREIRDILGKWQEVSDFVKKRHPDKLSTERVVSLFNDTSLTYFREILKRRKKRPLSINTL